MINCRHLTTYVDEEFEGNKLFYTSFYAVTRQGAALYFYPTFANRGVLVGWSPNIVVCHSAFS